MINIKLKAADKFLFIEAFGHALFDRKGSDIVCSSVSVLMESWVLSEKELCKARIDIKKDVGYYSAKVTDYNEKDKLLFDSMSLSLIVLEKQFSNNIKVIMEANDG